MASHDLQAHLAAQSLVSGLLARLVRVDAEGLDGAIDVALARVGAWLGVDRAYVFALDGEVVHNTHEWCARGIDPQIGELQGVPLDSVHTWVEPLTLGEPVHVPDVSALPDERSEERAVLAVQDIRSLLVVPILSLGELTGFVGFDACREHRTFTPSEQALLRSLADVIGASLVRRDANRALLAAERRTAEALRAQAMTDALTGLPNRLLLLDRIQQSCARARRNDTRNAVVMLDLDGFRLVNDGNGHRAGDDLLCNVAERLRTTMRANDTCARFGGDEFVLLLDDVGGVETALGVVARIRKLLAEPFEVRDAEHRLTASFGIRLSDGSSDADELVREAEMAMHEAKRRGRNRVTVFNDELRAQAVRRQVLANRLRAAIERDAIRVAYQPIVATATGAVLGAEALARWHDPQLGPVSPAEFVPLAEETGLIGALGARVLRTACRDAATWPSHLGIAVNLSRHQLADPGLVEDVLGACAAAGLNPRRLEVEVTESTVMTEVQSTVRALVRLRRAGVTVAIDDFGTGHSSLSLLRDLPADRLKIDRSFVSRIVDDERDLRLVRAVCGVADDFRLETVAEGVETAEQRQLLVEVGVPVSQGWFFGRAVTADEFAGRFVGGGTLGAAAA